MARKRMFDIEVVDTDLFLDMPQTTQNLYFHLGMRADDDGFVSNPKKIIKLIGANEDDLKILITKKFIIPFETGVIVIRHWKLNNYLRKDRYTETIYKEEKSMLTEDKNGIYNLGVPDVNQMATIGIHSIEENSIEKNSIDKITESKRKTFTPPTLEEIKKYIKEKQLSVDANRFYTYFTEGNWIDSKGNKVKNWKQKLITWSSHSSSEQKQNKKIDFKGIEEDFCNENR